MIFTSTPPALHLQNHFSANLDFGTPRPLLNVQLADDNLTPADPLCHYATDPIFIKIRKVYHKTCGPRQAVTAGQLKDDTQIWRNPLNKSQHLITIGKTSFSVLPTRSCIFYVFNEKWWCTQNSPKFYESLTRVFIHLWSGKLSRSGFPLDLCP